MGIYRRSRTHKKNKEVHRRSRTRSRVKDLDQVHADLERIKEGGGKSVVACDYELDPDLPGSGQFPCIPCSRFFVDQANLEVHLRTKLHKKRLRVLKDRPYTLEEAEAAGGNGSNKFYSKMLQKSTTSMDDC